MKRSSIYGCLVGSLWLVLCAGSGNAIINPPWLPDTTRPECQVLTGASELRYFGFFCSACEWLGTGSDFEQVKGFTNISWVMPANPDWNYVLSYWKVELDKARAQGQKAVVSCGGCDSATWDSIIYPFLKPYYDTGNILGFYMVDDGWNIPEAEARRRMQLVKRDFPEAVTIGVFIDDRFVEAFPELDWVGMEMYQQPWLDQANFHNTAFWQSWLDAAAQKMQPHQKFILVPGTMDIQPSCAPMDSCSREDPAFLEAVLRLATNNPRVVGIIPFLWHDNPGQLTPPTVIHGVSSLPGYQSRLIPLGECFTKRQPVGYLDGASCQTINGWSIDPDIPDSGIMVHLWDGPAGAPTSHFIGAVGTSQLRQDVNAAMHVTGNHGFSFPTPSTIKNNAPHAIYAYGINNNGNNHSVLIGSPKTIQCAPPAPPVITSPLTATGNVGVPFSYTLTATSPYDSINAAPMPAGLKVEQLLCANFLPGDCPVLISGTPTAAGTYAITLSATNIGGTGTAILQLTINPGNPGPIPLPPGSLPMPDLSGIEGRVFSVRDMLSLEYPGQAMRFNWNIVPVSAAHGGRTPGLVVQGAGPTPTNSPHFNLATLSLLPGLYTFSVQAINNVQQSNWASANITLASDSLMGFRVYPNPWRADRHLTAQVTFDNLPPGSTIKLFTVSAHWVKTLTAPTGSVSWDLNTDSGSRAASGLYLYLIQDPTGQKVRGTLTLIH